MYRGYPPNKCPVQFLRQEGLALHHTPSRKPGIHICDIYEFPCLDLIMLLSGLYIIADTSFPVLQPFTEKAVSNLLQPGVKLLQYRDKHLSMRERKKHATVLRSCCREHSIPLIINDDIYLAQEADADGVHLGKFDMPVAQARLLLGKEKIIGASCYQSLKRAQAAQNDGADYVAFGAVFPSSTKPEAKEISLSTVTKYQCHLNLPICAIGGITSVNIAKVFNTGIDMVAIASDILAAPDPIRQINLCLEAIKKMEN